MRISDWSSDVCSSDLMPRDETSTLAVHADVWSAETPYEVVQWTPLVDVHDTKAMYILPPAVNRTVRERMSSLRDGGRDFDLFEAYRDAFRWVPVQYGQTLVFSPILLHGNVQQDRSEEHTSELQSLMRISYAVFCLKTKNKTPLTAKHTKQ